MRQTVIATKPVRLSRKESAVYLNLSLRSLDYLIQAGRIQARRNGARTFVQVAELDRFVSTDSPAPIRSAAQEVR